MVVVGKSRSEMGLDWVLSIVQPRKTHGSQAFAGSLRHRTPWPKVVVGVLRGPDSFLFCPGNHHQKSLRLVLRLMDSHPVLVSSVTQLRRGHYSVPVHSM
jgi:hypothetical protein